MGSLLSHESRINKNDSSSLEASLDNIYLLVEEEEDQNTKEEEEIEV